MTRRISVLNHTTALDSGVYFSKLNSEMTLTNAKQQLCIVIPDPSADIGLEVIFEVPQDYSSTPVLVIKGVLDGTPANVLAFGAQLLQRTDSEAVDTAYEAEDTASNSTWTGYADEDFYEETITLTPSSAFVAGRSVFLKFYRDTSADTWTGNFLLTDLLFSYTEA